MAEPQGPCREMYFHEKSTDQKIQKLADAVEYLVVKLKEAGDSIELLKRHSHSGGTVTVPMDEKRETGRFSESYFFRNPLGQAPAVRRD